MWDLAFGSISAAEGARLAYHCTKVPGLFEKVPEVFRGVFWMKGNAISEELAVLQNGQWFEDELTYVFPFSPFMWAWAEGVPKGAPFFGRFYGEEERHQASYGMPALQVAYSLRFRGCPGSASLPWPFGLSGHICEEAANASSLRFATLQSHSLGDLRRISQEDVYSIEAMPDEVKPGAKWYRGIYGGPPWMGNCKCISVGSYELTKIIDGDGTPLEPYFSEFTEYMGDVPLRFWLGHADDVEEGSQSAS